MSSTFAMLAVAALLGLSELPPQPPAPGHCRTFLWLKQQPPLRIAMIDDGARTMRLQRGRQTLDLVERGPGSYEGEGYRITVSLQFVSSETLTNGAVIDSGSIRIEADQPESEALSFPVGGMRACG